jgi:hypothetical protein
VQAQTAAPRVQTSLHSRLHEALLLLPKHSCFESVMHSPNGGFRLILHALHEYALLYRIHNAGTTAGAVSSRAAMKSFRRSFILDLPGTL